jgi:hypothetical protein
MFPIKSPRAECISPGTVWCDAITNRAESTALEVGRGTHVGVCSVTPRAESTALEVGRGTHIDVCSVTPSQVQRTANGTCKHLWWSTQTVPLISQSHILICDISFAANCGDFHCILNFFRLVRSGHRMISHRPHSGHIFVEFSYPVTSTGGFPLNLDL